MENTKTIVAQVTIEGKRTAFFVVFSLSIVIYVNKTLANVDSFNLHSYHVWRTWLLRCLISLTPGFDQITNVFALVVSLGIVTHIGIVLQLRVVGD